MNEIITIKILDPKVKGLLMELQNLNLIQVDNSNVERQKKAIIEKLEGINLKDIDPDDLQNIIDKR